MSWEITVEDLTKPGVQVIEIGIAGPQGPAGSGEGGAAAQAFGTIAVAGQSSVVADAAPDTLTLVAGTGVQITTSAGSDTVTFAAVHSHTGTYDPAGTAAAAVTAHEAAADPHPGYLTQTEGDGRYSQTGHNHSGTYDPAGTAAAAVTAHEAAADPHPGYLTQTEGDGRYSQTGHNHAGTYDPAGTAAAAVTAHEAAADPHPGYLTQTEGDGRYSQTGHNHAGTYDPAGTAAAAVTAHEAAVDPHPGYLTQTEGDAAYASTAKGVTGGDLHAHTGGNGAQIDHTTLANRGTNTHAQIDAHLSSTGNPHSVTADQVLPSQIGQAGKILTTNGTTASWGALAGGGAGSDWIYSAKSADYTVLAADKSKFIDCTSAMTLTFSAPGTLGANWFCMVRNGGSGIVTLAHTSGNIDGLTSYLIYPGDTRFVQCDGSTLRTALRAGGTHTWTSGITSFMVPPGISNLGYDVVGGGGGGGAGRKGASSTARNGGGGGGGGSRNFGSFAGTAIPAAGTTISVEVGTGGQGAAAVSANSTNGGAGGTGGYSLFGPYSAYGGGPGAAGTASNAAGAGGGGILGAGVSGTGGNPNAASSGTHQTAIGGGGGGATTGGGAAGRALSGGGGGGATTSDQPTSLSGASSIWGGAGGGTGGGITGGNSYGNGISGAGGPGGGVFAWATGGGGSSGGSVGASGSAGSAGANGLCGAGGGGGNASMVGAGGTGGAGGAPGGGGGGGGASVNDVGNSGAGGNGGDGRVIVWYS